MRQMDNSDTYTIKKSKFKEWKSVFINSVDINVGTLNTGTILSKISGIINFFPIIYSKFLENKKNKKIIDFTDAEDMPILGKCVDVFEDGSFWAVFTPGHTKGNISYLINGKVTKTFITGDACISKKGFEIGVETGKYSSDIEEGRKSFLKIKEFIKEYPFVQMIFGHETDEFKINYI